VARPSLVSRTLPQRGPAVREFLSTEAGGAALLLGATIIALVWANSWWSTGYADLWDTHVGFVLGSLDLDLSLHAWVNDAAMAVFFLVVGLEINRELTSGELSERRSVAVPALGALGGLAFPALIYLAFNPSGPEAHGWGIAMSTDTAFVVGILALFGPRCPERLRLLLLTLAIVDDIGAITVMALFYTDDLNLAGLAIAAVLVAVLVVMRRRGVWRLAPYVVVAVLLWLAIYDSGVHPTLAGVLVGLLIPSSSRRRAIAAGTAAASTGSATTTTTATATATATTSTTSVTVSPCERLQEKLHPWSAYVVVPLFGLANAGVSLAPEALRAAATSSITVGIAVALVVGNAVGIFVGATFAIRTRLGVLPGQVRYSHLLGGAILAGIGFTISLFIAELAFDDPVLRDQAKIGVLAGSLIAAVLGTLVIRFFGERSPLCTPATDTLPHRLPPRPWLAPQR
jgi:NhaA family Na+:H+ antiporter